jgi:transcriptional regulator with XRE-family HTH domain
MKDKASRPAAPDLGARIAGRVRALRAARGLTLDALAAQCDVSRSMISLVERGESSASAVVLDRIATGLGVPLASLFDDASAPPNPVSTAEDRAQWRDPDSGYLRRNLSPPNFASPIQLVEVVLPAGARVAYENGPRRDARLHQQIWVLDGRIEVTIGNVTHRLAQDECLAMRLDAPTAFHNRTRKPARYLVALASEHARVPRS